MRERQDAITELRAEVESLKTTVANNRLDHEWPIVKQLSEAKDAIASQKRVIEKLKQEHEKNANEDYRGNRSAESVRSFKILKEVEAIEKGEA